ncbi:MAG: antibiotic biosynthesis monooxygenase family protein [Dehalococcoidia bacterium]
MAFLVVRHKVSDYSQWRPIYDQHGVARKAAGCQGTQVFRSSSDPNEVIALLDWDSHENARKFAESADLRETMQKAGVIDQPDIYFLDDAGRTAQ